MKVNDIHDILRHQEAESSIDPAESAGTDVEILVGWEVESR